MLVIFTLIILLFSIMIHEIAHGASAYSLGDPTAKYMGRLTLNPLKHLDPVGSVLVPLSLALIGAPLIGWAKPVPINPNNFRDKKWGELKVSFAGPASNLFIALFFGIFLRILLYFGFTETFIQAAGYIVFINLLLALFNLIPIPPLDGSHILFSFIPSSEQLKLALSRYGFFILIFIIFFFPWFFDILFYAISLIFSILTGVPLALVL